MSQQHDQFLFNVYDIKELNMNIQKELSPAKPTIVFDTYLKFAVKRQEIFFKRFQGKPWPWTDDNILQQYKFTNAYRASDRVSQYLIKSVIYKGDQSPKEVFFRIILFKLFNKIETWKYLEKELGEVTFSNYSFKKYDTLLTDLQKKNVKIYSAAYIMPSGNTSFGYSLKHRNHLSLIDKMMKENLHDRLMNISSMQKAYDLLLSYPTIGPFLSYQYVTDLNYSELTNYSEHEFVVPGPGAQNGIRKCFSDLGGLNETEIIRFVMDKQEKLFEILGLSFKNLWGRQLQLIDCQNLFCEVDKYSRIAHPEFKGKTQRNRIKQKFSKTTEPISFWYPPKWGINEKIKNYKQS